MGRLKAMAPRVAGLAARVAALPKVAEGFYLSAEWRALLRRIKAARGNWCEVCGAGGKGVRIIGDHIVERKDGGADLDERNVKLLCLPCHNRKTVAAKAKRARGGR